MNSDDQHKLDLTNRTIYKFWVSHTIRYGDLDSLGHVNNAVYSTFFEASRTAFMRPILKEHGDSRLDIVLARAIIDYRRELTYPGAVDIGAAIKRIGNTSFVVVNGIFNQGTKCCVAQAENYLVFFDLNTRKSKKPPQAIRTALESIRIT